MQVLKIKEKSSVHVNNYAEMPFPISEYQYLIKTKILDLNLWKSTGWQAASMSMDLKREAFFQTGASWYF